MSKLWFILLFTVLLAACSPQQPTTEPTLSIDGPASLSVCGSTGGDPQSGADVTSVRVQMVNASSRVPVAGSALLTYPGRSMGSVGNDSYTCEQASSGTDVFISAYAPGFAPTGFGYAVPVGSQVTFTVPLQASCSGAPSCFAIANLTGTEADARSFVHDDLERTFGIANYSLSCIECSLTRGGFIRAQGTLDNGTAFAAYVRHGWCSSGGSDCGDTKCFVTAQNVATLPSTCDNPAIIIQPSSRPQ